MVLSLVDLSLISITEGIKDGKIQQLQLLPPKLRQSVLDMALKRGLVNDPKCLEVLSSVEFLSGMNSFSTDAGRIDDSAFLERVIRSMGTVSPIGETIGSAITKLSLSIYGCSCIVDADTRNERRLAESNFPTVSRLIAECPNTVSLDLRGVESDGPWRQRHTATDPYFSQQWFPSLLNEHSANEACKRVMENLVELSICGEWTKVLGSEFPIIDFKRLKMLKMDNCTVQVDVWAEFLRKVPTLENLRMIDVSGVGEEDEQGEYAHVDATGLDWILPFPMPHLKSLEFSKSSDGLLFECNKAFVDNVIGCPNLRELSLMLDEYSVDEASLVRLDSMDIALKMKARLRLTGKEKPGLSALDSSSRFKVVTIFHERMDLFELLAWKWSPQGTTALEDVISTCSNLTAFRLELPLEFQPYRREIKSKEESKKVNAALVQFFTNRERALQLQDLSLVGAFDDAVLSAVFDNCLNLLRLKISQCPDLRDQHLIDWVARGGGNLTDLSISECRSVTNEGIISILAKSAEGLLRVSVHSLGAGARNWEKFLGTICPNAKIVDDSCSCGLNLQRAQWFEVSD